MTIRIIARLMFRYMAALLENVVVTSRLRRVERKVKRLDAKLARARKGQS